METGMQGRAPFEQRGADGGKASEVKQKASDLTQNARARAMSALDGQKSQVSGLLDRLADSVQDDRMGSYAAGYARRGAEFLRGRSADEIVSTVGRELRSRPGVLLSAAFVAGIAIARLVKGGSDSGGWREPEAGWRDREGWGGGI
jgi:hypothetical protein